MTELFRQLRDGRVALAGAAVWALFDALLHVAADMVEPPRIAGNLAAIGAAAVAIVLVHFFQRHRLAAISSAIGAGLVLGFNAAWVVANMDSPDSGLPLPIPAAIFIGVALALLIWAAYRLLLQRHGHHAEDAETAARFPWAWASIPVVLFVVAGGVSFVGALAQSVMRQLHDDRLEVADYWSDELVILSAGLGFDNIVGTPGDDFETTRGAGGTWYENPDCVDDDGPLSSAVNERFINRMSRGEASFDDGLPIVTSWPVLTSTVHPEDFLFTLNTGEQVVPHAATMVPNWERNERNTLVMFGDFGNRGRAGEPDQVFPVKLEIVDDGTPLMFVGPGGVVESGVGLTWETDTSPYDVGPKLVGAKLNHIGDEPEGEGGVGFLENLALPNDEFALYGGGDFKIRILTTGGFSPDGLTGVTPDQFSDFFRLHATGPDGETVLMTETGVDYELAGGTLRVVGLSDLGEPEGGGIHYDDCYFEDSDNYIDIILEGDEVAARGLTFVEIPTAAEEGYLSFYNPGGPGPEPFPEVRYAAPGPPDLEPIINALDDPMRVSYDPD
ncbi:MAG: phospholipase [Acidimicrobiia bacterium]|nr:phospholipase [Acidimicrobiia bacterium]